MGGVWTASLCLTVISGPGQSSYYYLCIPSFKDILVLREREFWFGRSRHEKLRSRSSLYFSVTFFFRWLLICRYLVSILFDLDYSIFVIIYAYIFTLTVWFWFFYVQSGSVRQIESYWDLFSILGRRGLESREVTLLSYIFYLPTDSQSYFDGQTWWQQRIRNS